MSSCTQALQIDRHFSGTIDERSERIMRTHLDGCAECRAYYARHMLLAKLDPEGISAEARIGRALGLVGPPSSRRALRPAVVATASTVLALAAGLLLWVRQPAVPHADDGFAARGTMNETTGVANGKPHLSVYRVREGQPPVRAEGTIAREDELAFAYENPTDIARLLVFAVDEAGRVYWFHPEWTRAEDDPRAIAIVGDGARHELPEAIKHPFEGSRLTIHALFTDRMLSAREVESMLSRGTDLATLPGSIHEASTFELEP